MATVARSAKASIDGVTAIKSGNAIPRLPGDPLRAGEDIDPLAPLYVKSSDGRLYMASGAANNEAAEVIGFSTIAYKQRDPVTVYRENTIAYYSDDFSADGVEPGDKLFVSGTKGRLDDTATTGDAQGVAVVLDNHNIIVTRASF